MVMAGQEMCVVEAMKMQNVLRCPRDGKVKKVSHVRVQCLTREPLLTPLYATNSPSMPRCYSLNKQGRSLVRARLNGISLFCVHASALCLFVCFYARVLHPPVKPPPHPPSKRDTRLSPLPHHCCYHALCVTSSSLAWSVVVA